MVGNTAVKPNSFFHSKTPKWRFSAPNLLQYKETWTIKVWWIELTVQQGHSDDEHQLHKMTEYETCSFSPSQRVQHNKSNCHYPYGEFQQQPIPVAIIQIMFNHQYFSCSKRDLIFSPDSTSSIMKQCVTMKSIVWHFFAISWKQSVWSADNRLVNRDKITSLIGISRQSSLLILSSVGLLVDFRHLVFSV